MIMIGANGFEDLKGLLEIPNLSTLDLSDNRISDELVVDEILTKIPNLGVLYLQGNEVCKKIKNYRKTLIHSIPSLKYLDDKPVFPEERRYVEAFFRFVIK
jgi:dynein assembly factor 1